MGHHDYSFTGKGTTTAEAYRNATESGLHSDDPILYSRLNGYSLTKYDDRVFLTTAQAHRAVDRAYPHIDSYDPAYAVAVAHTDDVKTREQVIKFTVDGDFNDLEWEDQQAAYAKAATEKARDGETFSHVSRDARVNIVRKTRETVRATEGKTETRFFLIPVNRFGGFTFPRWDAGFPSQAEARTAAKTALTQHDSVDVISMTRRVGGDPLVTARKETLSTTVTFTAVYAKPKVARPRVGSWLFVGSYHY